MNWQPEWLRRRRWEKVADRPHPLAIALALATPCIALAAFAMTIQSYRISREALRLSNESLSLVQRAYLNVADAKFSFTDAEPLYTETPHVLGLSFNIENVGNTPAVIKSLALTLSLPKGWSLLSRPDSPISKGGNPAFGPICGQWPQSKSSA